MVNNIVKRLQNIMRQDAGINGDAQRIEQMVWMFFMKVYDTQEETWEYKAYKEGVTFQSIIPEQYRWRNWAIDEKDGKALTGDALLHFINDELFPAFKNLPVTRETPRSKSIVREVFADLNQYMKNGVLLRQVINVINEIEFDDAEDRHMFGDIYEGILKDLQSAGNAGEFYTPRALTDFVIETLNPQLGETVGDFTSGTGGFLTSALNHLAKQVKTTEDGRKFQSSVVGQEWKPLPYLLSITNLLLHDVEAPNIRNCDSLGTKLSDFKESDKVNVIAMNPPYGGSTDAAAKSNFPMEFRSSETADLFMVLIMRRLLANGRAGVIIPDGFLFGTDGAKLAIKTALLREFNLHTIIRLPGSIFAPYTSINTNIVFFNNETAEGAAEGFHTKDVWFYRLDMPEGYKHFSKTKPMRLEHCQPIRDWWNDRREIITTDEEGNVLDEKSRRFTAQQLIDLSCNFDQCKFPKSEEEVLPPAELLADYHKRREALDAQIDKMLYNIGKIMEGEHVENHGGCAKVFEELSQLQQSFPARLRQSILQEAMQGKLVPQEEAEGTAKDFIRLIDEEKERIKFKKGKKFEAITLEEAPFDIPATWEWRLLGELAFEDMGKTPPRGESIYWANAKYPWVSIADMRDYGRIKTTKEAVSEYAAEKAFHEISPAGSLLMSFKLTVGRTSILDIDAYHNEAIITIKPFVDKEYAFRNYLFYILPLIANLGDSKDAIKGKTLNSTSLYALPIPVPPLTEQQRIVAKIEELFKEIDKLK